jgi:hypothetical protein
MPRNKGATPSMTLAYGSTLVMAFVYAVGLACSFVLPEPKSDTLPD